MFALEPVQEGSEAVALDVAERKHQCLHPRRGDRQERIGAHCWRVLIPPVLLWRSFAARRALPHVDRLSLYVRYFGLRRAICRVLWLLFGL